MPDGDISLPVDIDDYQKFSDMICERHSMLVGTFGSINGLSLAVQELDDPELENATYNGWKTDHQVNNVFVNMEGILEHLKTLGIACWLLHSLLYNLGENITNIPEFW